METYKEAKSRLISEIKEKNLLSSGPLKFPWFEVNGIRYWFKPQGIVSGVYAGNHNMGKAISCFVDFRGMSLSELGDFLGFDVNHCC